MVKEPRIKPNFKQGVLVYPHVSRVYKTPLLQISTNNTKCYSKQYIGR